MRKLITLSLFFFGFIFSNLQAQTYVWNRTDSADFQVATNWTPDRTTPAATDNLVFSNGAANTIAYNVPTQTVASVSVSNNTSIRLYSGAAITLTIGGGTNPVFSVAAGSTFSANASAAANAIVMNLTTGSTGSIAGTLSMLSNSGSPAHRFQSPDASSVTFTNGSVCICGPNFSGNMFGAGTAPSGLNSMIFQSGSRFIARGGSNPFGAGQPSSVVTFQSGSTFDCQITGPAFSGRTYANFELNNAGTVTATGSATSTIENITINDGTFNYNMTGRSNIKGNITVAPGKTMNIAPASNPTDSLVFNGTSQQSISGAGTFTITNTISIQNKVVLNNTAGLVLNKNVTIPGTLVMLSGNITTGANTLTLGTNILISGTLARTSGTIIGNFARWFAPSTVSNVLFPVGTASSYRPATISFTSNPFSGGTVTISHTDGTDGSDLAVPINDGGFNLDRRSNMFWTTSASFSDGVYDISFDGNGQTGINNSSALRLIYSNDGGTTFSAPGTHAAGSGNVASRTGITGGTYGQHYLAGNSVNNPLPVELDNFVATTIKNEVILDWATGHEQNNDRFEIQRARLNSGQTAIDNPSTAIYETVGSVKSKGNSNSEQSYKFNDKDLLAGRYAYRLKQIDVNGNHTYFMLNNEIYINNPGKFTISQNYPNPFNPVTNINYEMPFDGTIKIVVHDNLGREVRTLVSGAVMAGYYKAEFNASSLPSGIYFYRVNAESGGKSYEKVFKMMLVK
ncbi:MAG: T9SS type A sorting domain-containing protein [Bacteroidetes bacterium]|nr:T9SS type A sorting domain-containing protein [Bacteroidota bacterium]